MAFSGAQVTRLGLGGGSRAPYGSFIIESGTGIILNAKPRYLIEDAKPRNQIITASKRS